MCLSIAVMRACSLWLVTVLLATTVLGLPRGRAAAAGCGAAGAPTTTVYLPNVTKTLGGRDGWVTPLIVQNIGSGTASLEISFYRFVDGELVTCRAVGGVRPGTSFADVPNEDLDLPDDMQFAVVVRSYGSAIVAVVNEQRGAGTRAEAASYDGLSAGATTVSLPYLAKSADGWLTTFIVQNLGVATATVTISLTSSAGSAGPVLSRTIAPGRSAAVDPSVEPSIVAGEYGATVASDQPVAVVVNAHNDAANVAAPRAFAYNGIPSPSAPLYLPYVARNTDGIGRQTRVVVQNVGSSAATPTLALRSVAGGPAVSISAPAAIAPGATWSFDPRYAADGTTACPPGGSPSCAAEGEHSATLGGSFTAVAIVASPATAMGYAATAAAPSRVYLPNVTRTLGGLLGWTTPILVQSAGASNATLRWYRFADGSLAATQSLSGLIAGGAVRVDPRQVAGLADSTQYAVVVDATGPLAAVVTELSFQDGSGTMAYTGFPGTAAPVASSRDTLGMNVDYVADWSSQLPFVDVIRESRPWTSQVPGSAWGMGGPLDLDDRGWIRSLRPGQYGEIVMLNVGGRYPVGDYTLLYSGSGTLELVGDQVTIRTREPGRWVVHLESAPGAVFLRETATDPSDPIRDIHFVMPGFEQTYATRPFHPTFLERLRPFNVIRLLNWMVTNGSTQQPGSMPTWSLRNTPDRAFQSANGVAAEYMIQLVNELHAEPWFTIPHDLDDDGVRQFAMTVRDRLDPGLRVWLEYSNETWNSFYSQSGYVQDRGVALGLSADRFDAGERYSGLRAAQIFDIWRDVFGSRDRLVRVISSQYTVPASATPLIAGNAGDADVLAVGAYFECVPELTDTPAGIEQLKAMSDDAVLDRCDGDITGTTRSYIQQNLDVARRNGLRLVAYEGGQGLVAYDFPNDDALTAKLTRLNRSPRMYDLYMRFLAEWRDMVGDQFNHLSYCGLYGRSGSWGALEWQDQDLASAHKYRALRDMLPSMNPGRSRS